MGTIFLLLEFLKKSEVSSEPSKPSAVEEDDDEDMFGDLL